MNQISAVQYKGKPLKQDFQGWNFKHEIFSDLIRDLHPNTIIEVGTWKGASAITMATICRALALFDTKIYCVDTWLGALEFWTDLKETQERDLMLKNGYPSIYNQFLSNVIHNKVQDMIIPVPNTSFIGAKILQHYGVKAELIYIDGSHEYEDVLSDIKVYKELCTGVMFGDDYNWPYVKMAVNDSLKNIQIVDNFWIWRK